MLQIKNTLGGGKPEGLYAWKKNSVDFTYEEASAEKYGNVYMDTTPQSGSIKVYTGSAYTFDKSTGMYTIADPFEHSVALNGSTTSFTNVYLTYGSPTSAKMWTSVKNQGFQVYNNSSGVYLSNNISDYAIYAYSTKSEPTYTFLDYIVSDKETAYPDGGEKGGYWYEKVVEGFDPSILGCTKFETGTVTLASEGTTLSIPHSLGIIPKFVLLNAPDYSAGYGVYKLAGLLKSDGKYYSGVMYNQSTESLTSEYYLNANSTTTTCKLVLSEKKFVPTTFNYLLLA